jgi:hypothetical protein
MKKALLICLFLLFVAAAWAMSTEEGRDFVFSKIGNLIHRR